IIVGSLIGERLALGYITVNVVSSNPELAVSQKLRDKGYGVTSWDASGMDGSRLSLQVLTPRKSELKLYEDINEIDPHDFSISYKSTQIKVGLWLRPVRQARRK